MPKEEALLEVVSFEAQALLEVVSFEELDLGWVPELALRLELVPPLVRWCYPERAQWRVRA
jgi:hypothetical protein